MEQKVLDFIRNFVEINHYPPTTREICEGVGGVSTATGNRYLQILKSKGKITYHDGKPRTIVVLKESEAG